MRINDLKRGSRRVGNHEGGPIGGSQVGGHLLCTVPVNFCRKEKLVMVNVLVTAGNELFWLVSRYRYLPTKFWMKSPRKLRLAAICCDVESTSWGMLMLVAPPILLVTPSAKVNCWISPSLASMIPLVL